MTDTPIANMVEQMLDAGASASAVVLAVRAMERNVLRNGAERSAERFWPVLSMTPGAIRSRRFRKNHPKNQPNAEANDAANGGDHGVTPERYAERSAATDHCDLTSLSFLLSEPLKRGNRESKKEGTEQVEGRRRGTRLNLGQPLSDIDREFAVANGARDPDALWAEFVDFWIAVPGQRGTKLNWSATWRNRVRAVATKHGKSNGQAHTNGLGRALAALGEHVGDIDRGEERREAPPRLLSHG